MKVLDFGLAKSMPPESTDVIEQGDLGFQTADHQWVVAGVESVVRSLVDVDLADQVLGTDEFFFQVPGQVTAVEKLKLAQGQQQDNTVGIVRAVACLGASVATDRFVGLGVIRRRRGSSTKSTKCPIDRPSRSSRSLSEGVIDTTSASGELIFNIFSALAQFERRLIQERTKSGLAAARIRGRKGGRPPLRTEEGKVLLARKLHCDKTIDIDEICKTLHISRSTYYRYIVFETPEGPSG